MRNHCRTRRNQPRIALCDAAAALFGRMRRPRNGNGYTTGIGNSRSNQTAEHPAFAAVRPGQHRGYSADTTTVHPNRRQQDSETEERKQKDCYDGIGKIGKRAAIQRECFFLPPTALQEFLCSARRYYPYRADSIPGQAKEMLMRHVTRRRLPHFNSTG